MDYMFPLGFSSFVRLPAGVRHCLESVSERAVHPI